MQLLTLEQFIHLCDTATVVTTERGQPKVLESTQGEMIKVFYRRKGWSSSHLWPHAKRFVRNAQALQTRAISASKVHAIYSCPTKQCHVVIYPKVTGEQLRECLSSHTQLLPKFAQFLAQLHGKGVFFRGIHLGNVLYDAKLQELHLIDFADLKVFKHPLSLHHRARNLAHLFKNKEDKPIFLSFGLEDFLADYGQAAGLAKWQQRMMIWWVMRKKL